MFKLTVVVLAVVLAGTASAAGWRSLRIDGGSEPSFETSLAAFQKKLSPARRSVFIRALHDIWDQGTKAAEAEQREYTDGDYLRQLDGLGYAEVVTFTDPTGDTAQMRYKAAKQAALQNRYATRYVAAGVPSMSSPWPPQHSRPVHGRGWSPGGGFRPGGPQGD